MRPSLPSWAMFRDGGLLLSVAGESSKCRARLFLLLRRHGSLLQMYLCLVCVLLVM